MKLKRILAALAVGTLALGIFGCGGSEKAADTSAPVKVGVTAGPHAEIMDEVKKLAAKDGLNIEVVEFNDFVTPNIALQQGEIFANSMQHRPYLDATLKKEPGFELVEVFKTVNFPMAVYSDKIKKGEAIPDGAIIGIPNDPSNGGRALLLLAEQKLIEVKDINDVTTSVADITGNPHGYKFLELDAATIPRSLPDVTVAVINANYALPAGLNPMTDSLMVEGAASPYINIFVTKKENAADPRIKQLQKIYQSAEVEKFINDHFKGAVDRPVNTSKLVDVFARHGVNGTIVIYDVQKNGYWLHNAGRAAERFYPASTFKIFNSLIGLSEGVIKDADEVFYRYSGEPVYLESWKADASLRSAIKLSQVPAYKELARRIGAERMQANIKKLHYGNESIGSKIDSFWLEGPLKISALEQVKLLTALARRQLPYSQKAQQQVCDITVLKQTDTCTLHGKTGWATDNLAVPVGWFVGWVEAKDNLYVFALNMDVPYAKDLPLREKIALECLRTLKLL